MIAPIWSTFNALPLKTMRSLMLPLQNSPADPRPIFNGPDTFVVFLHTCVKVTVLGTKSIYIKHEEPDFTTVIKYHVPTTGVNEHVLKLTTDQIAPYIPVYI